MTDFAKTKSISAYREMVRASLEQYWLQSDQHKRAEPYFSFQILDDLYGLSLPLWRNEHLRSDFQEVINGLNSWKAHLHSWACWNGVIKNQPNEEWAWAIRSDFVEPLAFFCMSQPTSFRDRLTKFSTFATHYANLEFDPAYTSDILEEDEENFKRLLRGSPSSYYLSREKAEKQLATISKESETAKEILVAIKLLDTDEYRSRTYGWRNKAAHYIAPRFEFGETQLITRSVSFPYKSVKLENGFVGLIEDKSKMSIGYGIGGCPAIPLNEAYEANSEQYELARNAVSACEVFLQEMCNRKLSIK
jgi:hypothetical protein